MIRASETIKPDILDERAKFRSPKYKRNRLFDCFARQNTSEIDFLTISLAKTGNCRSPVNDERNIKPDFSYLVEEVP